MNQQEWKAKYRQARILLALIIQVGNKERMANKEIYESLWADIHGLGYGVRDAIHGKGYHTIYRISENKWAIKHNSRSY